MRLYPAMAEAAAIRQRADMMLTPERIAGECAYIDRPMSAGFERPYGWAWLLALHSELARHDAPWAAAIAPLAAAFAARFHDFLPKLTYPLRVGTHFNIAFALLLARHWAALRDPALVALIDARARDWFAGTAQGDWTSMAVPSDGSYGVAEGLISSFPVTTKDGDYEIVQGLEIDDFSREAVEFCRRSLVVGWEGGK